MHLQRHRRVRPKRLPASNVNFMSALCTVIASATLASVDARPATAQSTAAAPPAPIHEAVEADRPGEGYATSVVAGGEHQIESGASFTRAGSAHDLAVGEMLLRFGVGHRIELRTALNSYEMRSADGVRTHGLEDGFVGAKVRLTAEPSAEPSAEATEPRSAARPEVAVVVGTSIPNGRRPFGHHASEPEAALVGHWAVLDDVGFDVTLGAAARSISPSGYRAERTATFTADRHVTSSLSGFLEYHLARAVDEDELARTASAGLVVAVRPTVQIDAWVAASVHAAAPHQTGGIGVARRW